MTADIAVFFDPDSKTFSYVVSDLRSQVCAIIDPVLNFDPIRGRVATTAADEIVHFIHKQQFELQWIFETHVHADHLSAAPYLKRQLGGQIAIGRHVLAVAEHFSTYFGAAQITQQRTSEVFDRLLSEGEALELGELSIRVLHTPGHTPACYTFLVGDMAFVGDTLFMPDSGTSRTDFPGGNARTLYRSIRKILALPGSTRLFMCHDYKAPGRDQYQWETTVAKQREANILINDTISEDEFIRIREARDATLATPRLLIPALQTNLCAGNLPAVDDQGHQFLTLPLNRF